MFSARSQFQQAPRQIAVQKAYNREGDLAREPGERNGPLNPGSEPTSIRARVRMTLASKANSLKLVSALVLLLALVRILVLVLVLVLGTKY